MYPGVPPETLTDAEPFALPKQVSLVELELRTIAEGSVIVTGP